MAKGFVERLLASWGPAAASRRLRRGRAVILAYHNVVPTGERPIGDASLHLPQERFAEQLDILAELFEVVPLAEALQAPRGDRPRAAITFDDAYAGALHAGRAELVVRGMPATMFVTPGLLGGRTFWWDATASRSNSGWRKAAMERAGGHPDRVRDLWQQAGNRWTEMPPYARSGDAGAVDAFAGTPGATIGAHGWVHLDLTRVSPRERATELARPLSWLAEREATVPMVAYPYGSCTRMVAAEARSTGYRSGLRASGGWLPPPPLTQPLLAPRLNIPAGVSPDGFRIRVSGIRG